MKRFIELMGEMSPWFAMRLLMAGMPLGLAAGSEKEKENDNHAGR